MLVLTRRTNESIMIGTDIELKVLSVDGEQVKLGILAPKHIDIHRKEIYLSILDENKSAISTTVDMLKSLTEKIGK